jgi:hypothetical protein
VLGPFRTRPDYIHIRNKLQLTEDTGGFLLGSVVSSISLPGFENDVEQLRKSDNQTLSLLFKLPKDVRTRIYKFVIGSNVLHIVRRLNKLGHIACTINKEPEVFGRDQCRGTKVE